MVKPVEFGGVCGDAEAAIGDGDRVLHLRLALGQVAFVHQHAGLAHAGGEAPRQPAAIERFGAVLRDFLQRAREVGLADQLRQRQQAVIVSRQEHRAAARIGAPGPRRPSAA